MKILYTLAQTLLGISLFVHLLTFFGVSPTDCFPSVWLLHLLIFVIPMLPVGRDGIKSQHSLGGWAWSQWDVPSWIKNMCVGFTAYAVFNFFFTIFVLNEGGNPSVINGQKVLHNHGRVIRVLTDSEYDWHRAYVDRTFSGHWMIFYAYLMGRYWVPSSRSISKHRGEADH